MTAYPLTPSYVFAPLRLENVLRDIHCVLDTFFIEQIHRLIK